MASYDHKKIEKKWQKVWEETGANRAIDPNETGKPKYYTLIEFPYPSGEGLHVGHPRPYIALDIISRKRRGEGYNVLYPIGWDAFGLPTENYAVKTGIHPAVVTKKNSENFKRQIQMLGISFDWSREINTTDPAYYKWTQWIFLRLFKKGLAYKAKSMINWCPSCKIGLANEEAIGGICERCGGPTEKREKEQWMLAITKYADRLDKDLDTVDYLEKIKIQQRNWIGKSQGAEIEFRIKNSELGITVFTTRADTLFGATYLVVAPEHPLIKNIELRIENIEEVQNYIEQAQKKTEIERSAADKEKTGVELKGIKAINPATKEEIPIWVADYVIGGYGTGAIMAVPAHDERDFEFAKKFDLPITKVVDTNKYLIFDFDGVIGDTFEHMLHAKVAMGEALDLDLAREESIQYASNKPRHTRDHTLTPEQLQHEYDWTKNFGENMSQRDIGLFSEFIEEILKIKNTKIAIVSSGSELYIKPLTEKSKLEPTHILTFEDSHSKEEKIERICKDWNIPLNDIYYFTDTKADVLELESLLPKNNVIGCAWGYIGKEALEEVLPREHILENFADIHRLFNTLHVGEGFLINSGTFDGITSDEARQKITEKFGSKKVTYKLRDWVFSRQRYWGEPIPLVHCDKDGWVAIPETQLPVVLPDVKEFKPRDDGQSPLASITEWVNTTCPKCGGPAKRETDTMPNWAGSSWYYLRYMDPHNDVAFAGREKLDYWQQVDWYNGGMEHTTLHLLYSRFWHKFLYDEGLVPTSEPYAKRTSHGLILAGDGSKMSKSKGNVVNPDELVETFGADSLRLYEMFMGPFDQSISWNTDGVVGTRRFLERVWRLAEREDFVSPTAVGGLTKSRIEPLLHATIKKVGEDIESLKMNTAVSALMILLNAMEKEAPTAKEFKIFLRLLAPFAPHIAEELWEKIGEEGSIHTQPWPKYDPSKIVTETIKIIIQINGKSRGSVELPSGTTQEAVEAAAREEMAEKLTGTTVGRVIYVPNRLINIVTSQ